MAAVSSYSFVARADGGQEAHVGSVEEALVGIEVSNGGAGAAATEPKRGIGFVLRCDGFLLAPAGLFAIPAGGAADGSGQSVAVILSPGTERERRIVGVARPRYWAWGATGYVALKLKDVHVPSLRTRLPTVAGEGSQMTLAWRVWDAARQHYGPLIKRLADCGAPTSAVNEFARIPGGVVPLVVPIPDVPPGAVALDPNGLALGMVTGVSTGSASSFLSFEFLHLVTNAVTPVPTDDDSFQKSQTGIREDLRMQPVPGGKMTISQALSHDQPDLLGAVEVCIPPFLIDKFQVTNREYLDFWLSIDESKRGDAAFRERLYPRGWSESGVPFPEFLAGHPVLGVPLAGARAYARFRGKRLPTPYEWQMAAAGPSMDTLSKGWIPSYLRDRMNGWRTVAGAHSDYARENRTLLERDIKSPPAANRADSLRALPWITFSEAARRAAAASKRVVEEATQKLDADWITPCSILPTGSRPFDKSPSGAMDMILNGAEMTAPSPQPPTSGKLRWYRFEFPMKGGDSGWLPRISRELGPEHAGTRLAELTDYSLNRLVSVGFDEARRGGFILSSILRTASNVDEQAALLVPLEAPVVESGVAVESRVTVKPSVLDVVNRFLATGVLLWSYQRDAFTLWQATPRDFHYECGRTISLHALDIQTPNPGPNDLLSPESGTLTYLLPVGFRCAR